MIKKPLMALSLFSLCAPAFAARWQVEITNVTPGQSFTPVLAVLHYPPVRLFKAGDPASEGLAILAEGGDTAPLTNELAAKGQAVGEIQTIDGLLPPGETRSFVINGRVGQNLSLAAMLVPTNDTFFAVDSLTLPVAGRVVVNALAYDAGSEVNDQNCAHMPGPRCGGEGVSPVPAPNDEGFVHVGNGFHDLGTADADGNEILKPAHYDWNDPVAIVTIRRMPH